MIIIIIIVDTKDRVDFKSSSTTIIRNRIIIMVDLEGLKITKVDVV